VPRRDLDPEQLGQAEDWVGNNAAFTCPDCGKVFLVSQMLHGNGRDCPSCGRSHAEVTGGSRSGGTAWIEST
jgi:transposase-like protein